ncbi:MAG: CPBP family intramembrane metalloprotease [Bacteroidales bacterium]|nr:CPBP family intramembrane metalloprotease [Bacteroidales bacterium]
MKKMLSNPVIRILSVVILLLVMRFISRALAGWADDIVVEHILPDFRHKSGVYKFFMVIFSLGIMAALPGYTWKDFGFRKPERVNYVTILWLTFVIVVGGAIIFSILYLGLLNHIFAKVVETPADMSEGQSFLSMVLSIWIWSSITEEIYTRGLFQSLLGKLTGYKFMKLSLPVWLSGLMFGAMHLSVYSPGKLFFTMFIITQAFILGLLAGYFRERSRSLYPAILIHILANVYGSIMMLFG